MADDDDVRKKYLLSVTGDFFGLKTSDPALASAHLSSSMNHFLDSGSSLSLIGRFDNNKITFSNKVSIYISMLDGWF